MADQEILVQADHLHAVARAIFRKAGSSERECKLLADHLVEANLKGHDSHGIGMIPAYIESLLAGELKLNATLKTVTDSESLLVVDGGVGLGQSMAHDAMVLGIQRAKQKGSAIVALRNAHHIGRIGHWAEANLISIHFVNVIANAVVAPFGGAAARLVTNPVSIGIPRKEKQAVIVDFATSRLAHGKVRVAYNKGEDVPPGTLIDADGNPTNDSGVLFKEPLGALLPFGEHKGWTLAFACEALAGALTGGHAMKGPVTDKAIINNMFSIIVSSDALGTTSTYLSELEDFVRWAQMPPPDKQSNVLLPGDPEQKKKADRLENGIPVDPATWQQIVGSAAKIGMSAAEIHRIAGQ